MSPTDFVSLEEYFIYCCLTVHFSFHSVVSSSHILFHILLFESIGYLSDQYFSFSVMLPYLAWYMLSKPTLQHGKLCLAVFCYLRSCVQCLVDVSLHYLFSSWASQRKGGRGELQLLGSPSRGTLLSVLEKQFSVSIFLLGHSIPAMWYICA